MEAALIALFGAPLNAKFALKFEFCVNCVLNPNYLEINVDKKRIRTLLGAPRGQAKNAVDLLILQPSS